MFCSIRIKVTKYDVTFATKGGGSKPLSPVAMPLIRSISFVCWS